MKSVIRMCLALSFGLLSAAAAMAQYSSDAAANLAVGNAANEQNQVKVRATSTGGCYMSWYSNANGGYDLYLQRLDAEGNEKWAHNGVLVLDSAPSSTQDYGLAVDADDNAILSYRDDRPGTTQVGANKISPAGTLLWGPNGVVLSGSTGGNSPRICALSDGNYAVGYSASTSPSTTVVQKLDTNGAQQWAGNGIALADVLVPQRPLNLSDLQGADNGSVIALFQRCTGSNCITSNKQFYTQKLDASGAAQWGAGPLSIFDANSSQNGYFPTFIHDGAGGAVYGWYEMGGTRRALVQHVSSAGVELYAHNGVAGSVQESGKLALSPSIAYDAATDEIFMFWTETNSGQSQWGIFGQKFASGVRQWGDGGKELIALSTMQNAFIKCMAYAGGALVFAFDRSGSAQVIGMRVDANGDHAWTPNIIADCSTLSGKARLDGAFIRCGEAILAWGDARTDTRDIYAQNVRPRDGSIGATRRGDLNCDNTIDFFDIDPFLEALFSPTTYQAAYCGGSMCAADIDCSGVADFFDIDPFLECVFNVYPPCP